MSNPKYLTRAEIMEVTGVCLSSITRREKKGMPSRLREDGKVEYALTDLIEWELIDPFAELGDIAGAVTKSRTERGLEDALKALAIASVKIEMLETRVAELREDAAFLRGIVKKQAA
jgi:hypothetical protein